MACSTPSAPRHAAVQPLQIPENTAPTFTVYTGRDGLGEGIWDTIGFDPKGFVWAGSASSLAWFDGYRWHKWPLPASPSLVRDMATSRDGTLWAIFEHGGLARFNGRQWILVGKPRFYQRFSTVTTRRGPELWATGTGGAMYLQNGVWHPDPENAELKTIGASGFAETRTLFGETRQWVGSLKGGLWYRVLAADGAPEPWRRFDRSRINRMHMVGMLATTNDAGQEELWVLSYGGGMARIRADGIRIWTADAGELPSGALYSIVETHNAQGHRRLWVATRNGLLRIRNDGRNMDVFDQRNGLPSNAVRGVKVQHLADGTEVLWLATEGGIARAVLNESPWRTVSLLGSNFNGVFGLLIEPDGHGGQRLWVGSAKDGLALLDQGRWRRFTKANGALPSNGAVGIWRLPVAGGGYIDLLSLIGASLFRIDGNLKLVPFPTPWSIQSRNYATDAIARSDHGHLEWWVATRRGGIYRRRDGKWTHYTAKGASEPWKVQTIAEQTDVHGKSWLWAATGQGLARFDGQSWELLRNVRGLANHRYLYVTVLGTSGRQVLWAGTYHNGIVRLDVTDPLHPRLLSNKNLPPLPDQTVYSVLRDSHGRLYFCTNNGVQQLTPQPGGGYGSRVFTRNDGLVNDECNVGAQLIDRWNHYWAGTLGGLSMYNPCAKQGVVKRKPAPFDFTSITINGKPHVFSAATSFELPPGSNQVKIGYSLLIGQRERETRYRSQLIGYEPAPTAWTANHQRTFSNLPPGHYEFRVVGRDFTGTLSAPRVLDIVIEPFWWQRRVWQILILVLAIIILTAGMLIYSHRLRLRQRLLRATVAERTKELHVANERLTQLSYEDPLTGAANRRRLSEVMHTAIQYAHKAQVPLGLILLDLDHFKGYNDRYGHLAGDAALRAVAEVMKTSTREGDLVARFGGEEFISVMIGVNLEEATGIAGRIRLRVAALPPRAVGNDRESITVSVGVLSLVPRADDRVESLFRAVDGAMYQAKAGGRNRVVQKTLAGFVFV